MFRRPRYGYTPFPYNVNYNQFTNQTNQTTQTETTYKNEQTTTQTTQPTTGCYNTTYATCAPIYSTTKNVIDQYHVTKQPYICNYHTEVVHHYITENEYIPTYSKSDVYDPNVCQR